MPCVLTVPACGVAACAGWQIELQAGSGKLKVEIASRSVSSLRPFAFMRYELTPQMYFEETEYVRVVAEPPVDTAGDDDGEGRD